MVVLPKSFYRSKRFYDNLYMNTMTMIREKGNPDYMITMTANPKWKHLVDKLGKH
jgi:hypothetical protein